jgi:hypothetical protein
VLGWDLGEGDLLRCDVDGGGVSHTGKQGREGNGDELCVCVFFVAVNFFFVPLRTFLCLGLGGFALCGWSLEVGRRELSQRNESEMPVFCGICLFFS